MNKYFRIFPGMIGLIFAIILLGIGIIKDINKVKIEESCDKITATAYSAKTEHSLRMSGALFR